VLIYVLRLGVFAGLESLHKKKIQNKLALLWCDSDVWYVILYSKPTSDDLIISSLTKDVIEREGLIQDMCY